MLDNVWPKSCNDGRWSWSFSQTFMSRRFCLLDLSFHQSCLWIIQSSNSGLVLGDVMIATFWSCTYGGGPPVQQSPLCTFHIWHAGRDILSINGNIGLHAFNELYIFWVYIALCMVLTYVATVPSWPWNSVILTCFSNGFRCDNKLLLFLLLLVLLFLLFK